MAIEIKIKSNLMISTWSESITDEEMIQFYDRVISCGIWKIQFNHIVDYTKADMNQVTGDGLRRLAKLFREITINYDDETKAAFVAETEFGKYLMNIYKAFLAGSNRIYRTFDNLEDAYNWIIKDMDKIPTIKKEER